MISQGKTLFCLFLWTFFISNFTRSLFLLNLLLGWGPGLRVLASGRSYTFLCNIFSLQAFLIFDCLKFIAKGCPTLQPTLRVNGEFNLKAYYHPLIQGLLPYQDLHLGQKTCECSSFNHLCKLTIWKSLLGNCILK